MCFVEVSYHLHGHKLNCQMYRINICEKTIYMKCPGKAKLLEQKTNQQLPVAENESREKLQIVMRELLKTIKMI